MNGVETWAIYGLGGELIAEYAANAAPTSPQKEYGYRNGELLITAEAPAGTSATNVALAANGAVASSSSNYNDGTYSYTAAGTNNGVRSGSSTVPGEAWNAATGTFPQWVQVDFNGSKTIDEIDVITVQDNWEHPSEPTEAMTFSSYGVTGFEAQYWNGSSWATVPGGSVTGNNKVWKKISFAAITTTKIRVLTNASPDSYSRLTEVEAWTAATAASANIHWLVTDQLGTPRMIFDQTGSLANVSRHDYLPFGEELGAGTGGRTTAQGYSGSDNMRQKFTLKERDIETGLDWFETRYFSSTQGRFTSVDPLMASESLPSPQTWNRYTYSLNNPLRFTDPSGMAPGDFYNEDGKRLGTDGINDKKVYVVTDDAQAKQIQKTDKQGGTTQLSAVSSAVELPDYDVRQAIGAAVDRSNSATVDDKQGGNHEEGLQWGKDANGNEQIVNAAPGAYSDLRTATQATVTTGTAANPAQQGIITTLEGTSHVHPKGEIVTGPPSGGGTTVIGGPTTTKNFVQPPSAVDISNAGNRPGTTNIVVGARDKKVYVYDGTGVKATFPLKQFRSIK